MAIIISPIDTTMRIIIIIILDPFIPPNIIHTMGEELTHIQMRVLPQMCCTWRIPNNLIAHDTLKSTSSPPTNPENTAGFSCSSYYFSSVITLFIQPLYRHTLYSDLFLYVILPHNHTCRSTLSFCSAIFSGLVVCLFELDTCLTLVPLLCIRSVCQPYTAHISIKPTLICVVFESASNHHTSICVCFVVSKPNLDILSHTLPLVAFSFSGLRVLSI